MTVPDTMQAMVLTGLVVSTSASALALALLRRVTRSDSEANHS